MQEYMIVEIQIQKSRREMSLPKKMLVKDALPLIQQQLKLDYPIKLFHSFFPEQELSTLTVEQFWTSKEVRNGGAAPIVVKAPPPPADSSKFEAAKQALVIFDNTHKNTLHSLNEEQRMKMLSELSKETIDFIQALASAQSYREANKLTS